MSLSSPHTPTQLQSVKDHLPERNLRAFSQSPPRRHRCLRARTGAVFATAQTCARATRRPHRPLTKVATGLAGSGRASGEQTAADYTSRQAAGYAASATGENAYVLVFPTRCARCQWRPAEGRRTREPAGVRHERRPSPARSRPVASPNKGLATWGLAGAIASPRCAQGCCDRAASRRGLRPLWR